MKSCTKIMKVVVWFVIAVVVNGCGSGNLAGMKTNLKQGDVNRRQMILVKDVDISNAMFTGDKATDTDTVNIQKNKIPNSMKFLLASELSKKGFKVQDSDAMAVAQDAVVIDTMITRVNHGSGALRFLVGLGAGASWMEGTVKIYKADNPGRSLAEFQVSSSSEANPLPGDLTDRMVNDMVKSIVDYIDRNS